MAGIVVAAIGAFLGAVLLISGLCRREGTREPRCGKCGYCVHGLPGFTCPECGSDLNEVGIVADSDRRKLTRWGWIFIWSLFLLIPAGILDIFVPSSFIQWGEVYVSPSQVRLHAVSGAYDCIVTHTARRSDRSAGSIELLLRTSPGPVGWQMRVYLPSLSYVVYDEEGEAIGRGSVGFDEHVVLSWMRDAGINAKNTQIQVEAKEIVELMGTIASGTSVLHAGQSLGGFRAEEMIVCTSRVYPRFNAVAWIEFGAWVCVWLLGVGYISRRVGIRPHGSVELPASGRMAHTGAPEGEC